MELSSFAWNVVASLVAGGLVAVVGRITLNHLKKIALPVGATILVAGVISLIIFGVQQSIDSYKKHAEQTYIQEKVDRYLKGHYPEEFKFGWRIEVLQLQPKINLSLYWPKSVAKNPPPHPWEDSFIRYKIAEILKQEGHSSEPRWFYTLHPVPMNEIDN